MGRGLVGILCCEGEHYCFSLGKAISWHSLLQNKIEIKRFKLLYC